MSDPLGFILLLVIGSFCLVLAALGLRSGKALTVFKHSRSDNPQRFWYSIISQSGIGIACLVLAALKLFP
jgi:hypothetical protein